MADVEDVYKTNEILLTSVRITDKNILNYLNKTFALTREFYYGKILYADKQKCTIRVIRDLDTKPSIIPKEKIFSTYRTSVEFLAVDQIPIAEVDKDITGEDILTRNDIVKVPNYEKAQEFIKIDGNVVTFKTDEGFKTENIMNTLVVHGQTKYLFYPSSFLYQWWKKNKEDVERRMAENAKKKEEERLAALAAEKKRREEEASKRALKRLAELAEQKEAEEAAEQKQREAEEAKRKAEEERKRRESEEAKRKTEEATKKRKNKRKEQPQKLRRSPRQKKLPRRNPGRKARPKKSQLHEEYTEKLKF